MRRFWLAALAALLMSCGSPAEDFVGTYAVTGNSVVSLVGPPQTSSTRALTQSVSVARSTGDTLRVIADGCLFSATAQDDTTAVFALGERCALIDTNFEATIAVTSGTLTRSGSVLSVSYGGTVSGTSQGRPFSGTYTYRASGPRR